MPHDLRRSRVRLMTRAGAPQATAMKLTGHKTPTVFLSYDVVAVDDMRRAAERATEKAKKATSKPDSGTSVVHPPRKVRDDEDPGSEAA